MRGRIHRKPLAGHLTRSIEQAGASAYVWHDDELAAMVDPSGWWRGLARASSLALTLGSVAAGVVWSLAQPSWVVTSVVILALASGLMLRRIKAVAWQLSLLATMVVALANLDTVLPWYVGALGVTWMLVRPRHRDAIYLLVALITLVTCTGGIAHDAPSWRRWLVPLAVMVIGLIGAYLGGLRQLPRPFARVKATDMDAPIPSPPSRLPLLVQIAKGKSMESVPEEIRRKKIEEIRRKKIGGDGERRTGLLLLCLARGKGTKIVHDVVIPGADRANVDHLVLARSGLFVIDSKQFGRRDDPGQVVFDMGSREIVHRSGRGARSIESSLRTAAWAVQGIGKVVGVPATAILAIHNAAVEPGLRVERSGVVIEIMSSWNLVDRIDRAPRALSVGQMATARLGLTRLRSALNGDSPEVISPKGMDASMRGLMARHATRRSTVRADEPVTPSRPAPDPSPRQRSRRPALDSLTAPEQPYAQEGHGRAAVQAVPQSPAPGFETHRQRPVPSAQDQVDARWEQMTHSEPAAPDDVAEDLRGVKRGTAVLVIEFVDGDLVEHKAVAMTGPCRGERGAYIWFCSPEQWTIYSNTRRRVNVATVSTEKIMVRNQTGGEA
jgi:hypothetical protein